MTMTASRRHTAAAATAGDWPPELAALGVRVSEARKRLGLPPGGLLGAACAVVVALGAAGCTPAEPVPEHTEIPSVPSASGELVCGMNAADVETATGQQIDHVVGDIAPDATGTQECEIWPVDDALVSGAMLFVTVAPADSELGADMRARVDGTAPAYRDPDVAYEDADGGAWRLGADGEGRKTTRGALSAAFVGGDVIVLTSSINPEDRDGAVDLLPLSQQVEHSAALTTGS
jgi:hypothetical protein